MRDLGDGIRARELPAYLLDLLEPEARQRVERILAGSASTRQALDRLRDAASEWRAPDEEHPAEEILERLIEGGLGPDARVAALSHLTGCRECRFVLTILLTAREEAVAEPSKSPARPRRSLHAARLALAAAAVVIAALGAYRLGTLAGSGTGAPEAARAVFLSAERTEEDADAATLPADGAATLVVETVFPPESGVWSILDAQRRERASGRLAFDPSEPTLRSVAIPVPAGLLEPGAYVLRLRSEDGAQDRQWRFTVIAAP